MQASVLNSGEFVSAPALRKIKPLWRIYARFTKAKTRLAFVSQRTLTRFGTSAICRSQPPRTMYTMSSTRATYQNYQGMSVLEELKDLGEVSFLKDED